MPYSQSTYKESFSQFVKVLQTTYRLILVCFDDIKSNTFYGIERSVCNGNCHSKALKDRYVLPYIFRH